ncbi:transposase [Streptococcus dysgalactiae subsp. equisimilis AC-2713]|uniref:Transposase n=1 Tax=Streptococcus dysgalactiae subsp. equisimilis AC-2713 TaxID=759913 RepID=A0AB33R3U0_STREQ|nr:transposase [Streptococcus dysgalactiae subsp. equisimilis AC-2713]
MPIPMRHGREALTKTIIDLIRRWLPKGTKTTTPKEVAAIEHWINHYPKRLFNYKSPVEMLKLANFNLKFGFPRCKMKCNKKDMFV